MSCLLGNSKDSFSHDMADLMKEQEITLRRDFIYNLILIFLSASIKNGFPAVI